MSYDKTILIKIDSETKEKMDSLNINWSGKIREFIEREVTRRKRFAEAERIRRSLFKKTAGVDSAVIIRRMRAGRYG